MISVRQVAFALNCTLAVILALYVAFWLDLPNPWWAMVTVFLTLPPQPLVGAIWAKAFYRVIGTCVGLLASLAVIPNLANAPELMILVLALWVGVCLFISVLDRTPRAYVFMLAGYTMALVGLPQATNPTAIFDASVGRVEEIVIGVLASAIMQSVFFPRSVGAALQARLDGTIGDARSWIAERLRAPVAGAAPSPAPRIAIDLADITQLATTLRFEGGFPPQARAMLRVLHQRMAELLPLTTAIEDRLQALAAEGALTPAIAGLVDRVAAWVGTEEPAGTLVGEINDLIPELQPLSTWVDLLTTNLAMRLIELIDEWGDCLALAACLRTPKQPPNRVSQALLERHPPAAFHTDSGIAALSALVVALTIIGVAVFTVAVRWESGPLAIAIAAVLCSLFAAADNPVPLALNLAIGFVLALPLAALYEFAILPAIDGFVLLSAVLFPILMAIGVLMTIPRYASKALAVAIGTSAGLALQPTFQSSFPAFMNTYVGLLVGAASGLIGLSLARALPVQSVIRRIVHAGWSELAALTVTRPIPVRDIWVSRMLDRVALLTPRLAQVSADQDAQLMGALRDLRLGVSIIGLRHVAQDGGASVGQHIRFVLEALRVHFAARPESREATLPPGVVDTLDAAVTDLLSSPRPATRRDGVVAAVGLRRNLFPQAPSYQPPYQPAYQPAASAA